MERYAKTFWEKGSTAFAAADWERHVKSVEKGERKIEEITRWISGCHAKLYRSSDSLGFFFLLLFGARCRYVCRLYVLMMLMMRSRCAVFQREPLDDFLTTAATEKLKIVLVFVFPAENPETRLMGATKSFISKFANPWEQLTFHYTGTQGKVFNAHEDRCLPGACFLGRSGVV